jgi:AcrR family transcriptional regulator
MTAGLTHIIPPQQARSAKFLMRVLEAAERVLKREGADGLTMPAVAEEAQVSVGGIYRRFQTKQDLLRAIKDRHMARSEQAMVKAMGGDHASLEAVVQAFVATLTRGSGTGSLFGVIIESTREDAVMKSRGAEAAEALRAAFAAGVRPYRGEITHPDPDAAIDMAVFIAISVFTRHTKGKGPAALGWPDLRQELVRAMSAYLTA